VRYGTQDLWSGAVAGGSGGIITSTRGLTTCGDETLFEPIYPLEDQRCECSIFAQLLTPGEVSFIA